MCYYHIEMKAKAWPRGCHGECGDGAALGAFLGAGDRARYRESIEVREITRVVLGDIQKKLF